MAESLLLLVNLAHFSQKFVVRQQTIVLEDWESATWIGLSHGRVIQLNALSEVHIGLPIHFIYGIEL